MLASQVAKSLSLTALLAVMATMWWASSLTAVHAQQLPVHVFAGEAFIDSKPPPDGTLITARIDGRVVARARSRGGKYILRVTQPQGQSYEGKKVTFRVSEVQTGERRDWKPGRNTNVRIHAYVNQGRSDGQDRLPGRFIRECVLNALGRLPVGKEDMTANEITKANRLCPSLNGRAGALRNQQPRTVRVENPRPKQQPTLDPEIVKRRQELQKEQKQLNAVRVRQEQERIKRETDLQDQQDRLDRDRLKSERERQKEQASLDAERLKQEQDRIKAEKDFQAEQQRLDQRRERGNQARQEELDKARFESEKARIGRERALDEERARLDQDRLTREQKLLSQEVELNLNRQRLEQQRSQGQGQGPDKTPAGEPVQKGPSRGFFTNSQIGQMGSVNRAVDPSTLAVIGILITLVATTMQMVKGK